MSFWTVLDNQRTEVADLEDQVATAERFLAQLRGHLKTAKGRLKKLEGVTDVMEELDPRVQALSSSQSSDVQEVATLQLPEAAGVAKAARAAGLHPDQAFERVVAEELGRAHCASCGGFVVATQLTDGLCVPCVEHVLASSQSVPEPVSAGQDQPESVTEPETSPDLDGEGSPSLTLNEHAVLTAVRGGNCTSKEIRKVTGLSVHHFKRASRALVERGELVMVGRRAGARYVVPEHSSVEDYVAKGGKVTRCPAAGSDELQRAMDERRARGAREA